MLVHGGEGAGAARAGLHAQGAAWAAGRLEEEAAEVAGEDVDGLGVGPALEFGAELGLEAGGEQAVVGVGDGGLNDRRGRGFGGRDAALAEGLEGLLAVGLHAHPEPALLLAAADGQDAVRGDFGDRLGEVVVGFVLARPAAAALGHAGADDACFDEQVVEAAADRRGGGHGLGDDLAGALERGRRVGHAPLGAHVGRGRRLDGRRARRLRQDGLRERLQAPLDRLGAPRAALAPVVLERLVERRQARARRHFLAHRVRERAQALDLPEHARAAAVEGLVSAQGARQRPHLLLAQAAEAFPAVAREERHGRALGQQRRCVGRRASRQAQFRGQLLDQRLFGHEATRLLVAPTTRPVRRVL